jgi:PLP dependent protein
MADANPQILDQIRQDIAVAARIAKRAPDAVTLIAVSKTRSAVEIRPLLDTGHRVFGENRVQEAADKWPALQSEFPDTQLHLIGQLQSNKTEEAVALFDYIHSLDRPSLVDALARAMKRAERDIPCFIQVNIGDEPQKGGCAIADLPALIAQAQTSGITLAGLMCLPPADVEPAPYFALLSELAARHGLEGLSMGMSDDFATAITLGATHVRIGSALFGPRSS